MGMAESYDPDPIIMNIVYSDGHVEDVYASDLKEAKNELADRIY